MIHVLPTLIKNRLLSKNKDPSTDQSFQLHFWYFVYLAGNIKPRCHKNADSKEMGEVCSLLVQVWDSF